MLFALVGLRFRSKTVHVWFWLYGDPGSPGHTSSILRPQHVIVINLLGQPLLVDKFVLATKESSGWTY